ncbi:CDP-glucose 4,6-dehydratase [Flavisolibacter ginsenosidimutans]|uniref:CDP-glucose 4,6-dehydratase n=1 Tax=Flavisolibacter ginsenosidimutans TaxID=661481 RepID=A0A5B8UJA6_9BACT|nr:CDP-glucose 4,6-dehydratase [Flavisolibacter ginsenosidimutans]QEC56482.1 CDP-glucose 4,6-dehydratase [Flavisolibacter ginsenosidimutans]
MNLKKVYENKRIFLTGHTGFKGSWLAAWLETLGAKVKGYALPPEYPNGLFALLQPGSKTESVLADIRDKVRLKADLLSFEPDYVFHLAAQPLVRRSYQIPSETFDVNVTGTANVLEVVYQLKKKCTVVVITTDKVYENKEKDLLYTEEDALGGYDPYSASKACAEIVVSSFRNSFFHPEKFNLHQKAVASVRAGNVIGGGDWSTDRIIPDIVCSLKAGRPIEVRNPLAIRPWQHVLEPLGGYLRLGALLDGEPLLYSKAYNFGPLPQDHLTVREVVEKAISTWGSGKWNDASDSNQPHEAGILKLDVSRAKEELGWTPKLDSSTAIDWTVNWYKQPVEEQAAFTLQQINSYSAL